MNQVRAGHTPGPWEAHDDDGTGTLPCVLSDKVNAGGNFYVAQCNVFEDARLIASAPDLLEACQAIAKLADGQGQRNMMEVAGQARAAIAKAGGLD
jgi:hypothetical protein